MNNCCLADFRESVFQLRVPRWQMVVGGPRIRNCPIPGLRRRYVSLGLRGRCAAAPAHAWPRNQRTRSPVPQRSRAAAGRPSNTAAQLDMAIAGVQISAHAQLPSLLLASKESPCCLLSDAPTAVCARGLSSQREATAQGQLITDPRRCRAVFRGGRNSRGLSVDMSAKPATAASRCATH